MHRDEPFKDTADIPVAKRQRIEKGKSSKAEIYSPSQSPLRLDDEHIVKRELRQEGGQGNIIITPTQLEDNVPQEPLEPILDLIVADYRGKEIDPHNKPSL